ncbi:hypothetical protein [Providencia vermicola]|uniref:hypothetical protein n=1 Tax=Providencia vermicola TaxID=333965 RepID=UPI0018C5BC0B|nr:hypothetical protein [Proteus mirabilis]MBG6050143.1 hypothetical protein [Proteus mirabilis]
MKKKIYPNELIRKKRLKKSIKKSDSYKRRIKRLKKRKNTNHNLIMLDTFISDNLIKANPNITNIKNVKSSFKFKIPSVFDIFKNPEIVLKTILKLNLILLNRQLNFITIDHRNLIKYGIGSEALLGLLATEIISNRRKQFNDEISLKGLYPKNKGAKEIVKSIGLSRELGDEQFKDANEHEHTENVHYFRYDNRYHNSPSTKVNKKSEVAEECVKYLDNCMRFHKLSLKENAKNRLSACLGEVLDNAEEHSGTTNSIWYVRGYFNNVKEERYLELSVFNLGNSIFDNFMLLPENSNIKNIASTYVNRHKGKLKDAALFTVAALQGDISTKKDADPTRGQGSVTLIENFESIYEEYCKLRNPESTENIAEMNIISGETVVYFDGKYKSIVEEKDNGEERFIMPFNEKNTLQAPPDTRSVYTMNDVRFPGVMINIRIPLKGSTESLDKVEK